MSKKSTRTVALSTDYENDIINCDIPFSEYPRPQLKRDSYICLNGKWDFRIIRDSRVFYKGMITLPFCPESRVSDVNLEIEDDDVLVYDRTVFIDESFIKQKRRSPAVRSITSARFSLTQDLFLYSARADRESPPCSILSAVWNCRMRVQLTGQMPPLLRLGCRRLLLPVRIWKQNTMWMKLPFYST